MNWSRRDFVTASSLAVLGSALRGVAVVRAAGTSPRDAGLRQPPAEHRHVHGPRRHDRVARVPDAVVVVDSQFADTAPLLPRRAEDPDEPEDRPPDQHASPRRPHRGQQGPPAGRGEDRRARQRPGLQRKAAEANKATDPGVRRHDLRQGVEAGRRQRGGLGEVLRRGAHRRRRRGVLRAGERGAHGRPHVLRAQPPRRSAGGRVGPQLDPVLENVVKDHGDDTIYIFGHSKPGDASPGRARTSWPAQLPHCDARLRPEGHRRGPVARRDRQGDRPSRASSRGQIRRWRCRPRTTS